MRRVTARCSRARVLLDGARSGDLAAAWAAHQKATDEAQRLVDGLEPLQAEVDAAMEARDYSRVLEFVDRALPVAVETGFGLGVCLLLDQRGVALLNSAGADRADELEGAIEAFRAALEIAVSGAQAAGLLMHLGLAFGERIHGDRADNIETAIAALRDALAELDGSPDEDDELRAMILTNVAVFLGRSEREDRAGVAREAVELCREALRVRSPERDADDWAYSQLNLGEALKDLSELGEGDASEARAAFQAVLDDAAASATQCWSAPRTKRSDAWTWPRRAEARRTTWTRMKPERSTRSPTQRRPCSPPVPISKPPGT